MSEFATIYPSIYFAEFVYYFTRFNDPLLPRLEYLKRRFNIRFDIPTRYKMWCFPILIFHPLGPQQKLNKLFEGEIINIASWMTV